jgi:hypothetical protein
LPVAKKGVKLDDGLLFLQVELAPLDVRPEVVCPSQSATLAAPLQSCMMLAGLSPSSIAFDLFPLKGVKFWFAHTHLPSQAMHASSHGHAPQCRQAASDPPPVSMDLFLGRSSHSMVTAPFK